MDNRKSDIVGYIGGVLLIVTLFPQIYHTYTTKKTDDLSLVFLIMEVVTCIFLFTYGILIEEKPLIITNSVVFFELLSILYAKLVFSRKKSKEGVTIKVKVSDV